MNQNSLWTHHFLVAMPSLDDPNFERAVIYLCDHSNEGGMGFIINKILPISFASILKHLNVSDQASHFESHPVLMGGPVGQEHGFVVYENIEQDETEEEIIISASKETLFDIMQGTGPQRFLVALGYTGWGPEQLEIEVNRNDWLIVPYDPAIMFEEPLESRWEKAIASLGINIDQLSDEAGHA